LSPFSYVNGSAIIHITSPLFDIKPDNTKKYTQTSAAHFRAIVLCRRDA